MQTLEELLGVSKSFLTEVSEKKSYFSWLKRRLSETSAQKIAALNIPGLYFINESARVYPYQSLAANLIGGVGSDSQGLFGLEHHYNSILKGVPAIVAPAKDAKGRMILLSSDLASPNLPGHSIQLTIDLAIQQIADEALAKGVENAKAHSGFAIVSDPHTGRILAVSNYPTFEPNQLARVNVEKTKNYAFTNSFEPGSTIKPLVIAAAIDQNKTQATELFDCENGIFRAGGVVFRDDHPAKMLTTAETVIRSSNICTYKIAERLGKKGLYDTLGSFGIGGKLHLPQHFTNITNGRISLFENWKPIRFANIAFGQGLTTNGLEMVMAYGALVNGGTLMTPQIVDKILNPSGEIMYAAAPEAARTVLSSKTSRDMREMLARVVTDPHGTGKPAANSLYTSGGKTGTAEKVDPLTKAYSSDKRTASFIGFAPVKDPYLVVYVVVDEPAVKPAYGSLRAGPIFSEIVERSMRYLNVTPDQENSSVLTISSSKLPFEPKKILQ